VSAHKEDDKMRLNRTKLPATVFLLLGVTVLFGTDRVEADDESPAVAGVVTFDGPRPKRKTIRMIEKRGKPSDCQQLHKALLLDENRMVSEKGELANVFIYIKKGLEKKNYPLPKEPVVLNQGKCMFRPRVQGVRVGQDFIMKNADPLTHNIRSFSFRNRAFNIAQPAKSEDRKKVFTRPEKAVMIQCDIHSWMKAYYFVMDHPYFAVTNEKGQFKIEGLPPGEYTLAAWHEELGDQEAKITVAANGSAEVDFSFAEKAR
jgi:hypothetical protein